MSGPGGPVHVTYGGISPEHMSTTVYMPRSRNRTSRISFSRTALGALCLIGLAAWSQKIAHQKNGTQYLVAAPAPSSPSGSMLSPSNVAKDEQELIDDVKDNWVGMSEALAVILAAEIGDKSFFVALILAMRYDKWAIFAGSITALSIQAMLSSLFGALISQVNHDFLEWAAAFTYLIFGALMVYDGYKMDGFTNRAEAQEELEREGLIESTPSEANDGGESAGTDAVAAEPPKPMVDGFWVIAGKAFMLMIVAEFGDRTQIAMVVLSSRHDPWFVCGGSILGFVLVTAGAVLCGDFLSGRVSERAVTICGGVVFLLFAAVSFLQATHLVDLNL